MPVDVIQQTGIGQVGGLLKGYFAGILGLSTFVVTLLWTTGDVYSETYLNLSGLDTGLFDVPVNRTTRHGFEIMFSYVIPGVGGFLALAFRIAITSFVAWTVLTIAAGRNWWRRALGTTTRWIVNRVLFIANVLPKRLRFALARWLEEADQNDDRHGRRWMAVGIIAELILVTFYFILQPYQAATQRARDDHKRDVAALMRCAPNSDCRTVCVGRSPLRGIVVAADNSKLAVLTRSGAYVIPLSHPRYGGVLVLKGATACTAPIAATY